MSYPSLDEGQGLSFMKNYTISNLRNIGVIGHSETGKTSLVEALLYSGKLIERLGRVDDGTTITDFEEEEKKRKISLSVGVAPLYFKDKKINLVDIPGDFDFEGELIQGMRAVDVASIVVCGVSGVQVGTEKAWEYCNKIKLPRTFFINKLDREHSNYDEVLQSLKDKFGTSVVPIQYPIGKEDTFFGIVDVICNEAWIYNEITKKVEKSNVPKELQLKVDECREMIMEAVAETDEELLNKYFSEGKLSDKDIYDGLIKGCASGDIAPVMCGSSLKVIGMENMLDSIVKCFPSPEYALTKKGKNLTINEEIEVKISEEKPFSALVFKTIADPFVGKISLFRVITGKLTNDKSVINTNKNKLEKISHIFFLRGKKQVLTNEVIAGDIAAVSKLQYTNTGDTLCDTIDMIIYDKINLPKPMMSKAILPKSKGDEEKISLSLVKLSEEDPVFEITRDVENAETIISGIGETHLEVIANRLKTKFGADVELRLPKIPYRETIKGKSEVQGKHKKQSGGHGQYGDVKIRFEPSYLCDELEFVDEVVGGAVPRNYIPAVEKGLKDCMSKGVLAGYPVIALKATLFDGSYHTVDSSEMAFKIATSIAYKKGMEAAKPVILEPIMHVEIIITDEYMGEVIGDITKRRGKVLGMETYENKQKIIAEIPMAEMFEYATDLRSMTKARGKYTSSLERYEEVPMSEVDKIVGNAKILKELKKEA